MRAFIAVLFIFCHAVGGFDSFGHYKQHFRSLSFRSALRDNNRNELMPSNLQVTPQVAKLNAMAAKLRAEAAALEAENKAEMVNKLSDVFRSFDTNRDGKISLEELKDGLSKVLSASINDSQARQIMQQFDSSGDGSLQLDEFVTIESFRNKLDKIIFEERKVVEKAQNEAQLAKFAAEKAEAISAMINNKPPTSLDRVFSVLPFLLPVLDALPYAGYIIQDYKLDNNPVVASFAYLYVLYQTVPFSGLIAFFLFNLLSTNLALNRLVRYNIQLAIFLDIALIFPGIIGVLAEVGTNFLGFPLSPAAADLASDVTFISFISVISYAIISSLFGIEPDKIPFVTERIKQRVPTTEEFQKYYNEFEERVKQEEEEKQKNGGDDTK